MLVAPVGEILMWILRTKCTWQMWLKVLVLDAFERTTRSGWEQNYRWHWDTGSDWLPDLSHGAAPAAFIHLAHASCGTHSCCALSEMQRRWLLVVFSLHSVSYHLQLLLVSNNAFNWDSSKNSSQNICLYETHLESFTSERKVRVTNCLKLVQ